MSMKKNCPNGCGYVPKSPVDHRFHCEKCGLRFSLGHGYGYSVVYTNKKTKPETISYISNSFGQILPDLLIRNRVSSICAIIDSEIDYSSEKDSNFYIYFSSILLGYYMGVINGHDPDPNECDAEELRNKIDEIQDNEGDIFENDDSVIASAIDFTEANEELAFDIGMKITTIVFELINMLPRRMDTNFDIASHTLNEMMAWHFDDDDDNGGGDEPESPPDPSGGHKDLIYERA